MFHSAAQKLKMRSQDLTSNFVDGFSSVSSCMRVNFIIEHTTFWKLSALHIASFSLLCNMSLYWTLRPCPGQLWGPPGLCSGCWGAFTLGVKQHGCEADHSPPSNVKVKNTWSYTSTPPVYLGVVLN